MTKYEGVISMKRKRLNRDLKWGFQHYPYFQMNMNNEMFQGFVSIIKLTDGEKVYWPWPLEKAEKAEVAGEGMIWLQMIPNDKKRLVTAMFCPTEDKKEFKVSMWYVDVIEELEFDNDGVAAYVDKYIDVIATPQGDLIIDDRDELDEAYQKKELTTKQYEDALCETQSILSELFTDVKETEKDCLAILHEALKMIELDQCQLKLNVGRS